MWIALFAIGGAVAAFLAVIAFFAIILGCIWLFKRNIFSDLFDHPNELTVVIVLVIVNLALAAGTVGGGIEGYHRTYPSELAK